MVLGSVNIVLVTKNTYESQLDATTRDVTALPDSHARSWDSRQFDGPRETLVTLRIIVLQADLELDCFEEVPLFLFQRVFQKILHIGAHIRLHVVSTHTFFWWHSGDGLNVPTVIFDILVDSLPEELFENSYGEDLCDMVVEILL